MIQNEDFSDIPVDQRTAPWLEHLIALFQEQAQTIQKQAEQITGLKTTVQELRDELNRLKNLPKRPKFRPGGRPSNTGNSTAQGSSGSAQRTMPPRTKEEVLISQEGKEEIHKLYDQLIAMQVTSPGVQAVINNFRDHREGLLKALNHPGLPLHNNDSERDIRGMVKFRNVSGSTKSAEGQTFRDALMTLKQTCFRLGRSFWEYLEGWFQGVVVDLAQCVRERYRMPSTAPP